MGVNSVSHCFNLNGSPDPRIRGFSNIFSTYKAAISNLCLSGPTRFSSFLKTLVAYVRSKLHLKIYHVMIVLTDGVIHDKEETTDLIVELSKYPVSLIIVGIGSDNFEAMKFLDSDSHILRNKSGEPAMRDIV
mmetsp:Transcript_23590/g.23259  ORF Transcript_23590/g.23259 Transcript_23590/m.23259 type:complete len:133 (-) Transcript_23590:188-586(-)